MLFTGLDLLRIDRIRQSIKNPRFTARVFSDEERAYFAGQKDPAPSMAASFAAKEAFAKALGCGVRGFSLRVIRLWARRCCIFRERLSGWRRSGGFLSPCR